MAIEGKTKRITPAQEPGTVFLETFDVLTGGDAAKKAALSGIGVDKTTQTANVFTLLEKQGIPTAFIRKENENTLLCYDCDMLPLEFVVRRYAFGSYLLRSPEFKADPPHRFDAPVWEVFHKDSVVAPPNVETAYQTTENEARAEYLKDGKWADGVYTDPLIVIEDGKWILHPQKVQFSNTNALMETPALLDEAALKEVIEQIVVPTFTALEEAWSKVNTVHGPVALVDMKVELGRRKTDGKVVLADVIDNDSWRIWPGADPTKQLDKQSFRDDSPLNQVSDNYKMVAALTEEFLK